MEEKDRIPEKELNRMETSQLLDAELKTWVTGMLRRATTSGEDGKRR